MIEKYNIKDNVEVIGQEEAMIIKPKPLARQEWKDSIKTINENVDDRLIIDDVFIDKKFGEWK